MSMRVDLPTISPVMKTAALYFLAGIGASAIVAHVYMREWRRLKDGAFRGIGRSPTT